MPIQMMVIYSYVTPINERTRYGGEQPHLHPCHVVWICVKFPCTALPCQKQALQQLNLTAAKFDKWLRQDLGSLTLPIKEGLAAHSYRVQTACAAVIHE